MSSITSSELDKALQSENPPMIYDVRRKPALEKDPDTIPTATWQDHEAVSEWAKDIPQDSHIVVYCVFGHEVSKNAAQALRDEGLDALYLEGGIAKWKEEGLEVNS